MSTQIESVQIRDDLALLSSDGARLSEPMAPRAALDLAESITRAAFRRMMLEEAGITDRQLVEMENGISG